MAAVTPPLPDLLFYSRPGCHLCEEARDALDVVLADREARGQFVPKVVEKNIDLDPELHDRFFERIPVVELAARRLELLVTASKLRRFLDDAFGTEVRATEVGVAEVGGTGVASQS
jgi:hypothetical protein